MSDWKHKNEQCFIETHFADIDNVQVCNGTEVTYFEDFTNNHNKALIKIKIDNAQGCMVRAIIETRCGEKIDRPIPLFDGSGELALQVEDVCRVALRGDSAPVYCNNASPQPNPSTFSADVDVEKTFCICCPGDKDSKRNCNRCGSYNRCGCSRSGYRDDYHY